MCLTVRQNELRLGRQQISSQKRGVQGTPTHPVDELFEGKTEMIMMVDRRGGRRSQTRDSHSIVIFPPPMSLLAAARRQSTTFVCVSCRGRTYAARVGSKSRRTSAPTSPVSSSATLSPAETIYSMLQSHSAVFFACSQLRVFFRWHIFMSARYHFDRSQLFKRSTSSRCASGRRLPPMALEVT